MKTLFAVIFTILFASGVSAQCVRDDVVISDLKGKVVDSQGKEPVASVLISVRKGRYGDSRLISEVRTDISGNFDLTGLKKGKYELSISYPNFDRIVTRLEITKRRDREEVLQIVIAPPNLSGTDSCEGEIAVVQMRR